MSSINDSLKALNIHKSNQMYLSLQITPSANESEYPKVHIPLALMRYRDFLEAQKVRQSFLFLLNLVLLPPIL